MVVETFCAKPQCPQFVRGICLKGVEVIGRLAPANWGSLLITSSFGVVYTEALRILESLPIVLLPVVSFLVGRGTFCCKVLWTNLSETVCDACASEEGFEEALYKLCMFCTVPEDGSTDFGHVVFAAVLFRLVNCFCRKTCTVESPFNAFSHNVDSDMTR